MIKTRVEEIHEEEHPKPKPKISLHTLIYQVSVVTLLVMIAITQFVQIYYLRNLPSSGPSDANGPLAVEVVNRGLKVDVDNPVGELGTHPLVVEFSPYAAPIKVEIVQPQQTGTPASH